MIRLHPATDIRGPAHSDALADLRRNDVPLPDERFLETGPVSLTLAPPETVEAWLAP